MFKIKVKVLEFNKRGYTEALQKEIDIQVRQAAREWLRAVVNEVPVYTGQARSSLIPLGRYLRVAIDANPVPAAKKRKLDGRSLGESQQSYEFQGDKGVSTFSFSTQVPHYLINEFHVGLGQPPLIHPTPWHSLEQGKLAFQKYLRDNLKTKIPKISKYITVAKVIDNA